MQSRLQAPTGWLLRGRQGGQAIRAMGGEIAFPSTGPTDFDLRGRVLVSQPLSGAAKLLDFSAAAPPAIPEWFDGKVASVSLWGCNVPEAVTAYGHVFDELSEPGPAGEGTFREMLAGLRDDPEGPQVDLLRDLFPHLGPGVLQATDCREHGSDGKKSARRTLLLLQCRDHDAVAKTLKRFYSGDKDIRQQAMGKDTLWTIGEGRSLLFEGSNQSSAEVRAILLTDKTMILATEPEMLTGRLSGRGDSRLAESAAYKAVSAWWQAHEDRGPATSALFSLHCGSSLLTMRCVRSGRPLTGRRPCCG